MSSGKWASVPNGALIICVSTMFTCCSMTFVSTFPWLLLHNAENNMKRVLSLCLEHFAMKIGGGKEVSKSPLASDHTASL